jgi:hypothetical protein
MTTFRSNSQAIRRAANEIIRGLQIESFSYDASAAADRAGFQTYEHGRTTWYAATEQNIRDVLYNRWRHVPQNRAAISAAVQLITDRAKREAIRPAA